MRYDGMGVYLVCSRFLICIYFFFLLAFFFLDFSDSDLSLSRFIQSSSSSAAGLEGDVFSTAADF